MRNEPLHPEDIKCAIYKRGQTLEGLARLTGVNSVNIRKALRAPLFIGELSYDLFTDKYQESSSGAVIYR